MKVLASSKEDISNGAAREDVESLTFFFTIYIIFVKTLFSEYWLEKKGLMNSQIKRQIDSQFENYEEDSQSQNEIMVNLMASGQYQRDSQVSPADSRSQNSSQELESAQCIKKMGQLQDYIDKLQEENKGMKISLSENQEILNSADNNILNLNKKLLHSEDLVKQLQNQVREQEEEIEEFHDILNGNREMDRQQDQTRNFKLLQDELEDTKHANMRLHSQISKLKSQLKDNNLVLSIKSVEGQFQAIASLRNEKDRLNDEKYRLQEKLHTVESNNNKLNKLMFEKGKSLEMATENLDMLYKEKNVMENMFKNKERDCNILQNEINVLKMNYAEMKKSYEISKSENDQIFKQLSSQESSKRGGSLRTIHSTQEDSCGGDCMSEGDKINMFRIIEETHTMYTQELSTLYSLLHDHMISQLTGKSLQDLIQEKMQTQQRIQQRRKQAIHL